MAQEIVIVGGGAGGLVLAAKLARKRHAHVTLVDSSSTHLWKPLLHEVAAGSLNSNEGEIGYRAYARGHQFNFQLGKLSALDRNEQEITIDEVRDEQGEPYLPARTLHYHKLVIAIGSVTHDFGIAGVSEHCLFLDNRQQADRFHRALLQRCYAANAQTSPLSEGQLHIAIAGAGATGVELAAELQYALPQVIDAGLDRLNFERDIKIHLVEAAPRILPGLPERISVATQTVLDQVGINTFTNARIRTATTSGFTTQDGPFIPAGLKVWAAGVKAPDLLSNLDGLETNNLNQLLVTSTLQTTRDENIFALGDCAACPIGPNETELAPPRAQAAYQQASFLAKTMIKVVAGHPASFSYRDNGSLINLSEHSAIGKLMGNLFGRASGSVFIEGWFARLAYASLYKTHLVSLHGVVRVALMSAANLLSRRTKPRLKLH